MLDDLPVALEGAEVADAHAACPALLRGRPPADLADDHQLRARVAVHPQAVELVQQHILPTPCLLSSQAAIIVSMSAFACALCPCDASLHAHQGQSAPAWRLQQAC